MPKPTRIATTPIILCFLFSAIIAVPTQPSGVHRTVARQSATKPELPVPTGDFAVGRVVYHWTDNSRAEPLSPSKEAHREVMVYVWYPAAKVSAGSQSPPYMPDFHSIQKAVTDADLEDLFRPAYFTIQQFGYPSTHANENAAMPLRPMRFPVLVFSHGLGLTSEVYTAEFEDLASHGYVVAAIDHTYDSTFTLFPGGRFVTFAQEKWDTESKKPGGFLNYVKERVEVWAQDTRFVIDQLTHYDRTPSLNAPFRGRLDLKRIGAFGHSFGGLTSARVCQLDNRIRACMNQDSDVKGSPFVVDQPRKSFYQPFLYFIGPTADVFSEQKIHPTDEALVQMKLTRAEYDSIVKKQQDSQNEALSRLSHGSYRVTLVRLPGFTHRSFSDLPLLAAHGDATKLNESSHNFLIAQSYLRAFFDKYLKGRRECLLNQKCTPDPRVKVEFFNGR